MEYSGRLFNKNFKIESKILSDCYPGNKNCYHLKFEKSENNDDFDLHFIPLDVFETSEYLKKNFSQKDIDKLLPHFEKAFSLGYREGCFDESYDG